MFILAAWLFWPQAMAQTTNLLPSGSDLGIPGATADDGWAKLLINIFRFVLIVLFVVALGAGMGDSIFGIFAVINDARSSGQWGPAIKQIAGIMLAIAICLGIFALADKYVFPPLAKLLT